MNFIFIFLLFFSCTHDYRQQEFKFSRFFSKPKVKKVNRVTNFDDHLKIDVTKSQINFYQKYEKYFSGKDNDLSLKVSIRDTQNNPLEINPTLIHIKGLASEDFEVIRKSKGEYIVYGLYSPKVGDFKINAFVGEIRLNNYLDINFVPPLSSAQSEWKLIAKPDSHLRLYQLVIKDTNGTIMDVITRPEVYVEGEAIVEALIKEKDYYLVKVRFTCDDCYVYFGYKLMGQSVERFQGMNFKSVDIDDQKSYVYPSKITARADGNDHTKIYIRLLNDVGGVIYQPKDFLINLISDRKTDEIEGPIDGNRGVYFKVRSKKPGASHLRLWVDRLKISNPVTVYFLETDTRSNSKSLCLQELLKRQPITWSESDIKLVSNEPDFDRAWSKLFRVYDEVASGSYEQFYDFAQILSNTNCVMVPDYDELRENAVHELYRLTRERRL